MQTAADNKLQRVPCGHVLVRSLAKLTEPVGVEGDAEVSVTVAVQTEPEFTVTEPGTQLTTVEVGAAAGGVTVTEIGRASCREREEISVVAVSLKKTMPTTVGV